MKQVTEIQHMHNWNLERRKGMMEQNKYWSYNPKIIFRNKDFQEHNMNHGKFDLTCHTLYIFCGLVKFLNSEKQ